MSLSFWIRDYVFNPLAAAGRRYSWWPHVALVISMTLFGLWHGARLTFVVYGIYHGLLLVTHRLGQRMTRRVSVPRLPRSLTRSLSWAITFLLVSLGFICFRANNLGEAVSMGRSALSPNAYRYFVMPREFYILTSAIIVGYFAVEAGRVLLFAWRLRYRQALSIGFPAGGVSPLRLGSVTLIMGALSDFLGSRLWWWLAPAVSILTVLAGWAISKQGAVIPVSPFIYTLF